MKSGDVARLTIPVLPAVQEDLIVGLTHQPYRRSPSLLSLLCFIYLSFIKFISSPSLSPLHIWPMSRGLGIYIPTCRAYPGIYYGIDLIICTHYQYGIHACVYCIDVLCTLYTCIMYIVYYMSD